MKNFKTAAILRFFNAQRRLRWLLTKDNSLNCLRTAAIGLIYLICNLSRYVQIVRFRLLPLTVAGGYYV